MSYENLLNRHIDKEDGVVYKYTSNNLAKETMERIEKEYEAFENSLESAEAREKYINMLVEMENKYR